MSTSLARISELEQELAKITDLRDARKVLALAQGLMTARNIGRVRRYLRSGRIGIAPMKQP